LRQYSEIRKSFPSRRITAEGILFTLKKLVENTVEDAEQIPAFAEEAVNKLLLAYPPMEATNSDTLSKEKSTLKELTEGLKASVMFEENTLRDRYGILVSYASSDASSNELARTLISYRLARALQMLPSANSQTAFSQEILLHHEQLIALIGGLLLDKDDDSMDTDPTPEGRGSTSSEVEPSTARPKPNGVVVATDQCDFCSAPIPFSDLTTAICLNGHQFPRCGVSLLAIQAPGITKYCGICSTPVLNEEFVQAQEDGGGTDTDSSTTLAKVLFRACDACIFCGGKFIG
jgi:hypothetical protein